MADEIDVFTEEDANFINQELIKATAEESYDDIKVDWQSLQLSAKNFLKSYEILEKARVATNKNIINSIMADNFSNESIPSALRFSQQKNKAFYVRAEYTLAFDFDEKVAKFRGQVEKSAIYVHYDSNKQQLSSFNLPLKNLVRLIDENGRLMKISPSKLLAEQASQIEKAEGEFPNKQHMAEANAAYMGTKSRLMQYYFKINASWTQRKNGIIMWKESKKWVLANVNSFGDMKEAYIGALMTKHKENLDKMYNHTLGSPKYYDHDLIRIFFQEFIQKVTNKAAIVEEDIVTENGQYAVKSTGAGMPSIQQYLNVATWISLQAGEFDKNKLEAEINRLYPQDAERNKIIGEGNGDIGRVLNKLLRENKLDANQIQALKKIYKTIL